MHTKTQTFSAVRKQSVTETVAFTVPEWDLTSVSQSSNRTSDGKLYQSHRSWRSLLSSEFEVLATLHRFPAKTNSTTSSSVENWVYTQSGGTSGGFKNPNKRNMVRGADLWRRILPLQKHGLLDVSKPPQAAVAHQNVCWVVPNNFTKRKRKTLVLKFAPPLLRP